MGDTNWEQNQIDYKPDAPTFALNRYGYSPQLPLGQRGYLQWTSFSTRPVTDFHESLAYVARPRSKAMGAEPNSAIVIPDSINLETQYGFTPDASDHSGQFTRNIQLLQGFYKTIASELK